MNRGVPFGTALRAFSRAVGHGERRPIVDAGEGRPELPDADSSTLSGWLQNFGARFRNTSDVPHEGPTYNPGMEQFATDTLFPDSGTAGMRPDPTPEEIAESRAAIGRFGRDVLFGPERGSAIPFVDEASDAERLIRDWGLSEQEFRASAEAFGEGRIGSGLGWGLLGTMAAVPVGGWAGRAIGKLGKAARGVEPQITVRASDVKRVDGMGEHWYDIPDVTRPGETTRLPGGSGRDPGGQMTLGGRPMERAEVPDELFHVTTNMDGIMADGMIRVSEGLNRGAGGYSGTGAVSTTASRQVAETLRDDLIVFATIKTFRTNQEALDFFLDLARKSNFDEAGLTRMVERSEQIARSERATPTDLGKQLFNDWSFSRQHYGGPPSSIILGDPAGDYWRTVRPENIDILPIRKNMIPEEALVSNYDLGQRSLDEIQVYSDIPVSGRAGGEVAQAARSPLVQEGATTVPGAWAERALRAGDAVEVPTEWLADFREFNRRVNPVGQDNVEILKRSILEEGFGDALILEVGLNGRARLIEGNHRIVAALELGLENVPVRVITARNVREAGVQGGSLPSRPVTVQKNIGDGWELSPSEAIVGVPDPVANTPNLNQIGRAAGVR